MSDAKPTLALDLRCSCSATLFVDVPQTTMFTDLEKAVIDLGKAWTHAHAAHHQEPKK